MTLTKKKLKNWIQENIDDVTIAIDGFKKDGKHADLSIMSGKDGKEYCEYSDGKFYISFDGGIMYSLMNNEYGFEFSESFQSFLDQFNMFYEMGHSWNCSIYKN